MSQESFTILLTTDQNFRYQQNLQQDRVAVVVLVACSNKLSNLLLLIPDARNVLNTIALGEVIEVGGPESCVDGAAQQPKCSEHTESSRFVSVASVAADWKRYEFATIGTLVEIVP